MNPIYMPRFNSKRSRHSGIGYDIRKSPGELKKEIIKIAATLALGIGSIYGIYQHDKHNYEKNYENFTPVRQLLEQAETKAAGNDHVLDLQEKRNLLKGLGLESRLVQEEDTMDLGIDYRYEDAKPFIRLHGPTHPGEDYQTIDSEQLKTYVGEK